MAKRPYQQDIERQWEMNQEQSMVQQQSSKIPATTRYTQPNKNFNLNNSLMLGKNQILENNTSSQLDSSDVESDVSFQERLNCCHEKRLMRELHKYLQIKGFIGPNNGLQLESSSKSSQLMREIEERVFEEIKRSQGNNEVEKIKLTLRFIKRNQNLARIYFNIVKVVPALFQTAIFFLFKYSVIVYFEGRQSIAEQKGQLTVCRIKEYLADNWQRIIQELIREEKLQPLFNAGKEQMLGKRFSEFVYQWMQGFFMAEEGQAEKNSNARISLRQGTIQREKRKIIKKF